MFNPIVLRKAKIVYNFGLSEWNRVNVIKIGMKFNDEAEYTVMVGNNESSTMVFVEGEKFRFDAMTVLF